MRAAPALVAAVAVAALTGCAVPAIDSSSASCATTTVAGLVPTNGVHVGVNLDWGQQLLADYSVQLGRRPAVTVSFTDFPLAPDDERNMDDAVDQIAAEGGMLLLTLEPREGLATVTDGVAAALASRLDGYNCRGVPVIVRFAHEMNGSWYPWGQQPDDYVAAFRRLAAAVHAGAPGSAMMWAPNYGGGYPFTGGRHGAVPGSIDAAAIDTDGDGVPTGADDPYAPYWPGDDAVDWVGMSLYHWGDAHPWGENEVPEPGKFVAQLTGEYGGLGGDDRAVPDFYGIYGEQHGKPVAIPETAALFAPGHGGADELTVKQAWWRQVFAADVPGQLPRLAMINWFEWDKEEPEIGGHIDWTATSDPAIRAAYRSDLPEWALWATPPRTAPPA
ncbi:glycoside hydrolase family 26 protein [Modestobacter lapidis]